MEIFRKIIYIAKQYKKWMLRFFVFVICFFVLTNSSLWYDETIEYYFSKVLSGSTPGYRTAQNMYERLVWTHQPPLYNVLMYFWLRVFDSEFLFRFSGVVITLAGIAGLYGLVRYLCNEYWAAFVSILYAFTYIVVYYAQECAEYHLLLCMLIWNLYYFARCIQKVDTRNLLLFVISAALSVYSQYGAVFIVTGLAAALVFCKIMEKDRKALITIGWTYTGAFFTAALPLVHWFILPQMKKQGTMEVLHRFPVDQNIPADFVHAFTATIRYSFLSPFSIRAQTAGICICVLVFAAGGGGISLFLLKNKVLNALFAADVISWIAYYLLVKLKYYAYTSYGEGFAKRWGLAFVPLWFLTLSVCMFQTGLYLHKKAGLKRRSFTVPVFVAGIFYCTVNYKCIDTNWQKDTMRDMAAAWYAERGYETYTIVHNWSDAMFQFYITHDKRYEKKYQEMILNTDLWIRNANAQTICTKMQAAFHGKLPDYLYVVIPEANEELMKKSFGMLGYTDVSARYTGTSMLLCARKQKQRRYKN